MHYYLGVDWADQTHAVWVVDEGGTKITARVARAGGGSDATALRGASGNRSHMSVVVDDSQNCLSGNVPYSPLEQPPRTSDDLMSQQSC